MQTWLRNRANENWAEQLRGAKQMWIELMTLFWKMEDGSTLLCLCLSVLIIFNLSLYVSVIIDAWSDFSFFKQIPLFMLLSVHLFIQPLCLYVQVWIQYLFMSEFSYGRLPCGRPLMFQVCAYSNTSPKLYLIPPQLFPWMNYWHSCVPWFITACGKWEWCHPNRISICVTALDTHTCTWQWVWKTFKCMCVFTTIQASQFNASG